jgi:hypothetical protein
MTVCIAAIANTPVFPTIVAASDRMVTAGDITFEGASSKAYMLNTRIVALGAGDSSDEYVVQTRARERIQTEGIQLVRDAAECFAEVYRQYRLEVFERELLSPFGLTYKDFLARQGDLAPDFVARIDRLTRDSYLPISDRTFGSAAIIAGVDMPTEFPGYVVAHIYVVRDPGQVTCEDAIGFAAVGSGARQAQSYLMLSQYSHGSTFAQSILSVYSAKRQAENAPFVGNETDLRRVDYTGLGAASPSDLAGIEKIYQRNLAAMKRAELHAQSQMEQYMASLTKAIPAAPIQTPPDSNGHATNPAEESAPTP